VCLSWNRAGGHVRAIPGGCRRLLGTGVQLMNALVLGLPSWFEQRPRAVRGGLVVAAIFLIGALDHFTGTEIGLSIFYLAPIGLMAWTSGSRWGDATSVVGAVTWLAADLTAGHEYSHPLIPVWNMIVRLLFFVVTARLLAGLRSALARQQELSRRDALTGVWNSRHFMERAEVEAERCRRHGSMVTVAYLDVDGFKAINDAGGHSAGDTLLRDVAGCMSGHMRAVDVVARLGGDEFAILLPDTGLQEAAPVLERLRWMLDGLVREHGWPVTFSIGAVTFPSGVPSADEMVRQADDLMYSVKRSGKNGTRQALATTSGPTSAAHRRAGP